MSLSNIFVALKLLTIMKTQHTLLKAIFLFGLSSLFVYRLAAQETQVTEKRVMKVKMIRDKDGVKTVVDTTIENNGDFDVDAFLKSKGFEMPAEHAADGKGKRSIQVKTYSFTDSLKQSDFPVGDGKRMMVIKMDSTFTIDTDEISSDIKLNDEKFICDILMDTAISKYLPKNSNGTVMPDNNETTTKQITTQDGKKVFIIKKTTITKTTDAKKDNKKKNANTEVAVYPNPNHGVFKISFENTHKNNVSISIADKNAITVYEEKLNAFKGTYEKEIDLSTQPKGTYYLTIKNGKQENNSKIVIE